MGYRAARSATCAIVVIPGMPRMLLLLAVVALVVAYIKFLANVPAPVRKKRLQWLAYAVAAGVLVLLVIRTGAVSAGVLGAVALAALRAAPALIAWKRRGSATEHDTGDAFGNAESRRAAKNRMSKSEALQVMELTGEPTHEQVMHRYRELMRHLHPDRGGSNYLAAQLNEARRVLLGD